MGNLLDGCTPQESDEYSINPARGDVRNEANDADAKLGKLTQFDSELAPVSVPAPPASRAAVSTMLPHKVLEVEHPQWYVPFERLKRVESMGTRMMIKSLYS